MAMGETASDPDWFERGIIEEEHRMFLLSLMATRKACVYCLICRDGGPAYVKFGYSTRARKRMDAISTACPIPPRYIFVLGLPGRGTAQIVEAELHVAFADHRVRGEWFKFDLENEAHKRKFHAVLAQVAKKTKENVPEATDWLKCKIKGTKITPLPLKNSEAA